MTKSIPIYQKVFGLAENWGNGEDQETFEGQTLTENSRLLLRRPPPLWLPVKVKMKFDVKYQNYVRCQEATVDGIDDEFGENCVGASNRRVGIFTQVRYRISSYLLNPVLLP